MSLYQLCKNQSISQETLVGIQNTQKGEYNGNNQRLGKCIDVSSEFNFQIILKNTEEKVIENDLTGNTLPPLNSPAMNGPGNLIEDFLNIETQQQQQKLRRLSISGYHTDKSFYYEYEFFGRHRDENNGDFKDEDIMMTDDEDDPLSSIYCLLPTSKSRKGSIFSDYGNDMVMQLPQVSSGNIDQEPNIKHNEDTSLIASFIQKRRVKDLFKLNGIFGGNNGSNSINNKNNNNDNNNLQQHNHYDVSYNEAQPFMKKKYFWSRKLTIPITAPTPSDDYVINPIKLVTSHSIDEQYSLSKSLETTSVIGFRSLDIGSETISTTNIIQSEDDKNNLLKYNLSMDISNGKRKSMLPKTRGRKPSPILDASKPFGCNYCERRFKRQEHLKRHVRSLHMGEKPYGCSICGKKFSRSDNLNQHIKTHASTN